MMRLYLFICLLATGIIVSCSYDNKKKKRQVVVELPEKEKEIIENEKEKEIYVKCDNFNAGSIRNSQCPEGEIGTIVEFCREDGTWQQVSGECKKECDSEELNLDSNLVTFEKDIKPILDANCISCHGTINNYEIALSQAEDIIRTIGLDSGDDDCMPQGNCGSVDQEVFIDWKDFGYPESGNCAIETSFIDLDAQESAILEFLSDNNFSQEDAKFKQFFTFAHKQNIDEPSEDLKVALDVGLNNISFDTEVFKCSPLPRVNNSVCVMDIRALQRTVVDLDLIQSNSNTPIISNTQKGQLIREITGNDQPLMHFDDFIQAVYGDNNIYAQLMNLPNTFQELLLQFDIDFDRDVLNNDYNEIVTGNSGISAVRNTRLMTRFEGRREGQELPCWVTFDNGPDSAVDANRDAFLNPFLFPLQSLWGPIPGSTYGPVTDKIFVFDAQEIICTLPNKAGMLFALYAGGIDNSLQAFAPTNIVNCNEDHCFDSQIDNPVDCLGCHANGFIPHTDEGKARFVSGDFNAAERDIIDEVFGDAFQNQALFNRDNGEIARGQVKFGRVAGAKREFAYAYKNSRENQSLDQVAGLFFVSNQEMIACIERSNVLQNIIGSLVEGVKINKDVIELNFDTIRDECNFYEDQIL